MKWDDESISQNEICGHITNTPKTADTRQKSQKGQFGLCDPVLCSNFTDQDFVLLLKYLDVFKDITIITNESSHPAPENSGIYHSLIEGPSISKIINLPPVTEIWGDWKIFLLWKNLSKYCKCKESPVNHVVKILGIFDPLPPPWSILLNNAYVIKWSFWLTFPLNCPRGLWMTLKLTSIWNSWSLILKVPLLSNKWFDSVCVFI